MKLRALLATLAVMLSMLLGTAPAGVRAAADLPMWAAGDSWAYNVTSLSNLGVNGTGTFRLDVVGTESVTVGNASYPCYKAHTEMNQTLAYGSTTTTISSTGHEWHRTSDLAIAEKEETLNLGGVSETVTTTYNPAPSLHWPLVSGESWTAAYQVAVVEVAGSITLRTVMNLTSTFRVQPEIRMHVPAGWFNATALQEEGADQSTNVTYWSASAGNFVRLDSIDFAAGSAMTLEMTSSRYQVATPGSAGFLGLSVVVWSVLVVAVVAAVVVVVLRRRASNAGSRPKPPTQPPQGGGQAPPAQPPAH